MKNKKSKPKIISAVDLSHLPQGKTIPGSHLSQRRQFLKRLCQLGIVVGLPSVSLVSCEPEENDDNSNNTGNDSTCTCQSDTTCACQSDSGCACEADSAVSEYPVIEIPSYGTEKELDQYFTDSNAYVEMWFDRYMDMDSVKAAFEISPLPPAETEIKVSNYVDGAGCSDAVYPKEVCKLWLVDWGQNGVTLAENTTYTVTVKGTAKDLNDVFLDGNKDGTPGDDFVYTIKTLDDSTGCSCESDSGCTCQTDGGGCGTDSCTCVSFTCSCQFAGCPTYRI
jgi:hypothetical protein